MRKFVYEIGPKEDGLNVSEDLRNCHGYSRRIVTRLKQGRGSLAVNGEEISRVDVVLHTGDLLEVILYPEQQEFLPFDNPSVQICYEDEDLIVFDKPENIPVHPSHLHREDTLANYYRFHCDKTGQDSEFHLINRLDRNTSGLVLVAKNALSAKILTDTEIEKTYFAVCEGIPDRESGVIDAPIGRTGDSIITRMVTPEGQPAITNFQRLQTGNGHALMKIRLETGRTHQIRVHFSHLGYPLAGDDLYGGHLDHIGRQALHCGELRFPHPITDEIIEVRSNLPMEFYQLLKEEP